MTGDKPDARLKRRAVLKTVGAAAATSATASPVTGRITGDEDQCAKYAETHRKYAEPETVSEAIKDNLDFFDALAAPGNPLDDVPSISRLDSEEDYLSSNSGVRVWSINGPNSVDPVPHITIRREGPNGGRLSIALKPNNFDKDPIALYKPTIPELGGAMVNATLYRPDSSSSNGLKTENRPVVPHNVKKLASNPGLTRSVLKDGGIETQSNGSTTADITPQAIPYGCITKGEVGSCESFRCYLWEVSCSPCMKIDCTGNLCCGGCCCCDNLFFCCKDCQGEPLSCSGCNPGDDPYACNDCPDCSN